MIANMADTKDGSIILPFSRTVEFRSIFDVEREMSLAIANTLKLYFQEEQIQVLREREPSDIEAYAYCQIGQHFEKKFRDSKEENFFKECVKNYQKAIKIDPNYALAYWGLGNIYESHFIWRGNKEEDLNLMEKNFRRAYEIDPGLAEAYLGMGWVYFYKFDNDEAYNFFKIAHQKDPDNYSVNYQIGSFFYSIGLWQPALKFYTRSLETNPLHINCHRLLARCYSSIGEFDKAANRIKIALSIESDSLLYIEHAKQLIMMKKLVEAESEIAKAEEIPSIPLFRAWLAAAKGERDLALELLKYYHDSYNIAVTSIYSFLGMEDKAIEYIERGIKMALKEEYAEAYTYPFLNSNPYYNNLKDDSRFLEILDNEERKYKEKMSKYGGL